MHFCCYLVDSIMGSGESQVSQTDPINQMRVTGEIRISVHGARRTGKTALLRRMQNLPFQQEYEPTPSMQSIRLMWRSITYPAEFLRVEVWDVVDQALPSEESAEIKVIAPDAGSVDTFSRADGVIIIYDPMRPETVEFAARLIAVCPAEMPIILISNFLDLRENAPKVDEMLLQYMERVVHVQVSLKTNKGLPVVAKWLDQALLYSKRKYYEALYKRTETELEEHAENVRRMTGSVQKTPVQKSVGEDKPSPEEPAPDRTDRNDDECKNRPELAVLLAPVAEIVPGEEESVNQQEEEEEEEEACE